jgi:hypothetical protein
MLPAGHPQDSATRFHRYAPPRRQETSTITSRRRPLTQAQAAMELYASARMVDSVAGQLLMLSEDDCLTDAEHDELEDLGRACRRVAEALYRRAGHA